MILLLIIAIKYFKKIDWGIILIDCFKFENYLFYYISIMKTELEKSGCLRW